MAWWEWVLIVIGAFYGFWLLVWVLFAGIILNTVRKF